MKIMFQFRRKYIRRIQQKEKQNNFDYISTKFKCTKFGGIILFEENLKYITIVDRKV